MGESVNQPALLAADILSEIAKGRAHPRGFLGMMEDGETQAGRALVPLGATRPFPLPSTDFKDAVLSLADGQVRIVLVTAKHPGRGAFRRLVRAIISAGLAPVVCEPVGFVMPAIMKRWGWRESITGCGFDRVAEWRPHDASGEPRHG